MPGSVIAHAIAELQAKDEAEIAGIGHVHVRALLLFQGEGAVRSMLKEKWSSMGIVSALLLTITIPFIFEPPSFDHVAASHFEVYVSIFQIFMMLSSSFSSVCIYQSIFWLDALNTWCPSPADAVYFDGLGFTNDPLNCMQLALLFFFIGVFYAYILSSLLVTSIPTVALSVVLITVFGYLRFWNKLLPLLVKRCNSKYNKLGGTVVEV